MSRELDDIKTVTRQEAFDRFWELFVVQEMPACSDDDGNCLYYKAGHPGCAVGCLLDEEDRKRLHDSCGGNSIRRVASSIYFEAPSHIRGRLGLDDESQVKFLVDLQRLHDRHAGTICIRAEAEAFAAKHGLSIPQAEGGAA